MLIFLITYIISNSNFLNLNLDIEWVTDVGGFDLGKSIRGSKEFSREQKLIHENQRLKRDNAKLRKQLARIDLDRYETIREMIEDHGEENKSEFGAEFLENLKKTWLCDDCRNGHLEIILFNKLDSTYYYRKCSNCPNRTKSQKYSPSVQGIIKKAPDERN